MKRVLCIVLASIMALTLLAACADNGGDAPSEGFTIGISWQGPNNDWAINMQAHLNMALAEHSGRIDQVIFREHGWEDAQQIANIEDLMLMDIDLLITFPHSDTGLVGVLDRVSDAGIPAVIFGATPGTDQYTALVKADTVAIGRAEGAWMVDRLGGQGNVLVILGAPGTSYAVDVLQGYSEAMANYPGMNIIGIEYAFWSPVSAKEIMESYIARGDQIDGVIVSGLMGLGVLEAFVDAGLPVPPLTAGDGWTGFLRRAEEIGFSDFAALPLNDFIAATEAVNLAIRILDGETVPKDTFIPPNPMMPAGQMLGMLTDDMPPAYWIGGIVPMNQFNDFID